ncbi:shikimate dehydrogenase family protein [Mesorhizobium sp. L-8-3]|uniref:shikimate dehydrogenase family protein n=1 Tax=Mesorhizobium sp. L-8-3 TaxID=2744522 RepID=UPI0019279831|nr:shikimate dehydrogenase [Mesorhizobium sp. L-8-3]BCH26536.1 shikimate dehydrogenase [Mesorhizobium sp. L-8-3]
MTGFFPSGSTRLFPVVGDPVAQVRSPDAITRILVDRGLDAVVVPLHVPIADIAELLGALSKVRNVGGVLVTVPHKRATLSLCATTTERAAFAEAVNVLRRTESGWHGDNTDGLGYVSGIEQEGFTVAGKRALLVGCGGAGSAIALELLERGAALLAIHDVDVSRRDDILARLGVRFPGRVVAGSADPSGFDFVANATPMGMSAGDPPPVDLDKLQPWQFVACVVTKPEVPLLILAARRLGCRTMTGTGMFDAQAETLADFLLGEGSGRAFSAGQDMSFVS